MDVSTLHIASRHRPSWERRPIHSSILAVVALALGSRQDSDRHCSLITDVRCTYMRPHLYPYKLHSLDVCISGLDHKTSLLRHHSHERQLIGPVPRLVNQNLRSYTLDGSLMPPFAYSSLAMNYVHLLLCVTVYHVSTSQFAHII